MVFCGLCGILAYFFTHGFTELVHNTHEFLLAFSCNPLNGSLWFLFQMVDRLEIFVWICGLWFLIACSGTGWGSHFRRFSWILWFELHCRQNRYADLFRYAEWTLSCTLSPDFSTLTHFDMPFLLSVVSQNQVRSTGVNQCTRLRLKFDQPNWIRSAESGPISILWVLSV